MTVTVKIGTYEGTVSSLNLVFENGFILGTKDMTWHSADEKHAERQKFYEVLAALRATGWTVKE